MYYSKQILFALVCAILLVSLSVRQVDSQVSTSSAISGSFDLTFSSNVGTSKYTLQYSYPSAITLGQNLTVTVTVFVDQLTELKLYVFDWGLQATMSGPGGIPVSNKILSAGSGNFLYQGSHWGPVNVVIPITSSNFNLTRGKSFTTQVILQWIADVQYDKPYNYHFQESDQRVAGNLTVVNPNSTSGTANYYYLGAAGAIVVIGVGLAWIVTRGRIKRRSLANESPAAQIGK